MLQLQQAPISASQTFYKKHIIYMKLCVDNLLDILINELTDSEFVEDHRVFFQSFDNRLKDYLKINKDVQSTYNDYKLRVHLNSNHYSY